MSAEAEAILALQVSRGRDKITANGWARNLFERLVSEFPDVPDDDLARLFHRRGEDDIERIEGDARFLQYNLRTSERA